MKSIKYGLLIPLLTLTPTAYADDDNPVIYSWHCGMSGFYELDVAPDGSVKPTTDYSLDTSIQIFVREAGAYQRKACGWDDHSKHLYIEVSGNGSIADLYNRDYCSQIVKLHKETHHVGGKSASVLNEITGVLLGPMSIIVNRDDAAWRYIMSITDLVTSRDSRELNIFHPKFKMSAKASASFITGECILEMEKFAP